RAGADGENRHGTRAQRALLRADDALRARERDAERDDRVSLRSPREPRRDGHPAAAGGRALVESVPGVDAPLRTGSAAALARCEAIVAWNVGSGKAARLRAGASKVGPDIASGAYW